MLRRGANLGWDDYQGRVSAAGSPTHFSEEAVFVAARIVELIGIVEW